MLNISGEERELFSFNLQYLASSPFVPFPRQLLTSLQSPSLSLMCFLCEWKTEQSFRLSEAIKHLHRVVLWSAKERRHTYRMEKKGMPANAEGKKTDTRAKKGTGGKSKNFRERRTRTNRV